MKKRRGKCIGKLEQSRVPGEGLIELIKIEMKLIPLFVNIIQIK